MAHESVLSLRAGPDGFLKSGSLALISVCLLFLLYGPAPMLIKVPGLIMCAGIGYLIYYRDHEASGTMLDIFPDGRVRWQSCSGRRGRAVLSNDHWRSLHFLLVTAADEKTTHRFLVCRSLQADQDFRTLRTWIRLGLPRKGIRPGGDK